MTRVNRAEEIRLAPTFVGATGESTSNFLCPVKRGK